MTDSPKIQPAPFLTKEERENMIHDTAHSAFRYLGYRRLPEFMLWFEAALAEASRQSEL